jgi:ubiquinone/menaquinone biosynthesis C-methylase UbiE
VRSLRSSIGALVRRALRQDDRYYPIAYRKADLERNYWSIVGPSSPEEFSALGKGKKELLVELGLTPDSSVLDVGCGTGLLTAALAEYLSSAGRYVGTDLAPEAVAFCQKRFGKANFQFLQSHMTRVPIASAEFDFVFLGSVFTHMYPREVSALLADLARLLGAGGRVVADAFSAPGIGSHRGGRGMVVIDEALLEECFREAGYLHEVIRDGEWEPGVRRRIFLLRRA